MNKESIFFLAWIFSFAGMVSSAQSADEALVKQDILQYLDKLQENISALRSEVGQLRQAVSEIHRAAVLPSNAGPLSPPAPVLTEIALGNSPSLGDVNASVAIVEFTDFECPFCQRFHIQTFDKIKEEYIVPGKIRYVLRNFPLAFPAQAQPAAIAANCAGEQGKYWDMYHLLFVNQRRLGAELFEELAVQLNLNGAEFTACLQKPAQAQAIEADVADGKTVGVRGTPNFFVGRIEDGKMVKAKHISGAQPFASFQQALESLLQ